MARRSVARPAGASWARTFVRGSGRSEPIRLCVGRRLFGRERSSGCITGASRGRCFSRAPPGENLYVRVHNIASAQGKRYALLLEFGARLARSDGVRITLDVGGAYADVEEWFGRPGSTAKPDGEPTVFVASRTRNEPPVYYRAFQSPSVRPDKSYFLYFESDEPLKVKAADFSEY